MAMAIGTIVSRGLPSSSLPFSRLCFLFRLSAMASPASPLPPSPSSLSPPPPPPPPPPSHSFHSKPLLCAPSASALPCSADSPAAPDASGLDSLDIRVGKIIRAWSHPEADSLYVEEVDMGEAAGPRTICSGLVKYVPEQELQGRAVIVLANLKPRSMRGVKSNGMLLAASDFSRENVELLVPHEGSIIGERVWFGCESDRETQGDPATPNQVQKKKIWEAIQPHLRTTDACVATFKHRAMRTSAGVVTCKSLREAIIS